MPHHNISIFGLPFPNINDAILKSPSTSSKNVSSDMNDNLGIGVMSSINYKDRYTACGSTWLRDFDNTYIFGGHNANETDNNLISINGAGENWESCFLKQQLGLKYMYEDNPNYNWYGISGCDNILFKNRLIKELNKYNQNDDFLISQLCGIWTITPHLHECYIESDNSFRSIAGGASFFISNSLMKKCYPLIDEFNQYWEKISGDSLGCSDVAIALMIRYLNIAPTKNRYMLSQNPSHYEDIIHNENSLNRKYHTDDTYHNPDLKELPEIISNPVSFHYINPIEMKEIYEKYK